MHSFQIENLIMTLIVNLSTTHDYSIKEIIAAFAQICKEYSRGCFECIPGLFHLTNYGWVTLKYQINYKSLIEPYRLGKLSTEEFLDNLTEILYFLCDMDKEERNSILAEAWNASIKLSEKTQDRLSLLVEEAKTQPVYLISNTNELNVNAILDLFKQNNPDLKFKEVDTSIKDSKEPIEILPNIYLCLSYRYGAFKEETVTTMSLLEHLSTQCSKPITLVSQFPGDRKKGEQLGLEVWDAEEFYNSLTPNLEMKKAQ